MKLTFVLADMWSARCDCLSGVGNYPPKKRTVTIELTEKQLDDVTSRYVGCNGTTDMFEEIVDIFIDDK